MTVSDIPDGLPARVDLFAYRIVQESLTNVLKHAGDDPRPAVSVVGSDGRIDIEIIDHGRGATILPARAEAVRTAAFERVWKATVPNMAMERKKNPKRARVTRARKLPRARNAFPMSHSWPWRRSLPTAHIRSASMRSRTSVSVPRATKCSVPGNGTVWVAK